MTALLTDSDFARAMRLLSNDLDNAGVMPKRDGFNGRYYIKLDEEAGEPLSQFTIARKIKVGTKVRLYLIKVNIDLSDLEHDEEGLCELFIEECATAYNRMRDTANVNDMPLFFTASASFKRDV